MDTKISIFILAVIGVLTARVICLFILDEGEYIKQGIIETFKQYKRFINVVKNRKKGGKE